MIIYLLDRLALFFFVIIVIVGYWLVIFDFFLEYSFLLFIEYWC